MSVYRKILMTTCIFLDAVPDSPLLNCRDTKRAMFKYGYSDEFYFVVA